MESHSVFPFQHMHSCCYFIRHTSIWQERSYMPLVEAKYIIRVLGNTFGKYTYIYCTFTANVSGNICYNAIYARYLTYIKLPLLFTQSYSIDPLFMYTISTFINTLIFIVLLPHFVALGRHAFASSHFNKF